MVSQPQIDFLQPQKESGLFLRSPRLLIAFLAVSGCARAAAPDRTPPGAFVYLRDVAPSIVQDMRYATARNFTGKPVPGYRAAECILKRRTAEALKRAQEQAQTSGFSLKVFDCYRPERSVRAFLRWAQAPEDGKTKSYYPHLHKFQLVPGYIAPRSSHSTGDAVDVTLVSAAGAKEEAGGAANDCTVTAVKGESADMGTGFDCFDPKASTASPLAAPAQYKARMLLKSIMEAAGFKNYSCEWWHFALTGDEDKHRYDFPILPRRDSSRED